MFLWIKQIYLKIIFDFYANHQATINCDSDIKPTVSTCYDGMEVTNWIANQPGESDQLQKIVFLNAEDLLQNPTPDTFYIFNSGNNIGQIITSNQSLFFNPEILKIALETPIFIFVKSIYELNAARVCVQTKKIERSIWTLANHIVFIILVFVLYVISRRIVTKLAMMDPIFSEFSILSSSLLKYKDVADRSMPQCTICFDEFELEEDVRMLECKHYFHPMCIDRWLIGHSKRCPCCRGNIEIIEQTS